MKPSHDDIGKMSKLTSESDAEKNINKRNLQWILGIMWLYVTILRVVFDYVIVHTLPVLITASLVICVLHNPRNSCANHNFFICCPPCSLIWRMRRAVGSPIYLGFSPIICWGWQKVFEMKYFGGGFFQGQWKY